MTWFAIPATVSTAANAVTRQAPENLVLNAHASSLTIGRFGIATCMVKLSCRWIEVFPVITSVFWWKWWQMEVPFQRLVHHVADEARRQ